MISACGELEIECVRFAFHECERGPTRPPFLQKIGVALLAGLEVINRDRDVAAGRLTKLAREELSTRVVHGTVSSAVEQRIPSSDTASADYHTFAARNSGSAFAGASSRLCTGSSELPSP